MPAKHFEGKYLRKWKDQVFKLLSASYLRKCILKMACDFRSFHKLSHLKVTHLYGIYFIDKLINSS